MTQNNEQTNKKQRKIENSEIIERKGRNEEQKPKLSFFRLI